VANCELIKQQLDMLIEERDSVEEQLGEVTNPIQRSNMIFELRALNHDIATKRREYNGCVNPPPPRPDLVAKTIQITPNHVARTMEIAGIIENDGDGPARGSFQIVLGVTYTDENGVTYTRELPINVPDSVTIEGHGTQYTTEAITNIPLIYRFDTPDPSKEGIYQFDMLVDANNNISETSESNNVFHSTYWTVRPST
jgi:hypothetical protein